MQEDERERDAGDHDDDAVHETLVLGHAPLDHFDKLAAFRKVF